MTDLALADLVLRSYAEPEEFGLFRVRCEVDPESGAHLIGFSGTVNVVDWMSNLRLWMTNSAAILGARMHAGFEYLWRGNRNWPGILPSIRAMIWREAAKSPASPWFIAGHSLGGVLATLTAELIRVSLPDTVQLVTFGMPRFTDVRGNAHLAALLPSSRHYRLGYDPIPKLPSWRPWRPYSDPIGVVNLPRRNVARMLDWKDIPVIRRHDLQRYRDELALDAA